MCSRKRLDGSDCTAQHRGEKKSQQRDNPLLFSRGRARQEEEESEEEEEEGEEDEEEENELFDIEESTGFSNLGAEVALVFFMDGNAIRDFFTTDFVSD